jgi:hypothetical protein
LRLELQHLSTKNDNKNWSAYAIEFNLNSAFSIYLSDLYNYQNPKEEKKFIIIILEEVIVKESIGLQ